MILDTINGFRRRAFTKREIEAIRTWAHINTSPDVAAHAGITFEELRQFVNYTRTPSDEVLHKLARRLQVNR